MMIRRQDRTVDEYMKAGAMMRLLKEIGSHTLVQGSRVMSASDSDKMMRVLDRIDQICSRLEDNMFHDHPELSNDYLSVFYGAFSNYPRNPTDEKVVKLAREIADSILGVRHTEDW